MLSQKHYFHTKLVILDILSVVDVLEYLKMMNLLISGVIF